MRDHREKVKQERFGVGVRKNILTVRTAQQCCRLPRDVVQSLPLEAFKTHLDKSLNDSV